MALPDMWLSGSLLAQAHWNETFGLPALHGMDDADIIYFDADDLSEAAEQRAAARIAALFADMPVRVDVKNEARGASLVSGQVRARDSALPVGAGRDHDLSHDRLGHRHQ